jgi:trans-aconitate 2-methyltransferase
VPHDWDAAAYDRLPIPMTGWGLAVLERLPLRGDERVLDVGCGTGQVTLALLDRLPEGEVVALDASSTMLERVRERLGDDRVTYVRHDVLEPIPIEPVDAILSTATFHWVPDHDRLFANLATVLRAGGRLIAQCGGAGNIANVSAALASIGHDIGWDKVFPTPEETTVRLERAGFADIECELVPAPITIPIEDLELYLSTVCLGGILDATPVDERAVLVAAVAERMGEPRIDYVRLNISARRVG